MRKPKLYLETSVWNFCFAEDAADKQLATLQFFEQIKQGAYDIFVSGMVFKEVAKASAAKKNYFFISWQNTDLKSWPFVTQC